MQLVLGDFSMKGLYQKLSLIMIFTVVISHALHGGVWDWVSDKYEEWRLGKLKSEIPNSKNDAVLQDYVEEHYREEVPLYVRVLSVIPVRESTHEYVRGLHKKIKLILDDALGSGTTLKTSNDALNKKIVSNKQFNTLVQEVQDITSTINIIEYSNNDEIVVPVDQSALITKTIDVLRLAETILSEAMQAVTKVQPIPTKTGNIAYQVVNQAKQKSENVKNDISSITNKMLTNIKTDITKLEALKKQKPITAIERWHRNRQFERLKHYIDRQKHD
jgi:hypothetical protein